MTYITLNLPERENNIVDKKSKEWRINKQEAILRMIRSVK